MKVRPILMSAPMVLANLDGTKTQTRRILKQPRRKDGCQLVPELLKDIGAGHACPYGAAGDLLWVRESFSYQWPDGCDDGRVYASGEDADPDEYEYGRPIKPEECDIIYRATDTDAAWADDNGEPCEPKWKPSIHMPRRASRLTLEIISVRVERLQSISEMDAFAEGIDPEGHDYSRAEHFQSGGSSIQGGCPAVFAYIGVWNKINGAGAWDENPWVWVIEYKVHRSNVDDVLKAMAA